MDRGTNRVGYRQSRKWERESRRFWLKNELLAKVQRHAHGRGRASRPEGFNFCRLNVIIKLGMERRRQNASLPSASLECKQRNNHVGYFAKRDKARAVPAGQNLFRSSTPTGRQEFAGRYSPLFSAPPDRERAIKFHGNGFSELNARDECEARRDHPTVVRRRRRGGRFPAVREKWEIARSCGRTRNNREDGKRSSDRIPRVLIKAKELTGDNQKRTFRQLSTMHHQNKLKSYWGMQALGRTAGEGGRSKFPGESRGFSPVFRGNSCTLRKTWTSFPKPATSHRAPTFSRKFSGPPLLVPLRSNSIGD